MLTVKPMSLADANRFVAEHHRHHKPVRGHKFSLGCMANGHLAGVAIVGRPVSRYRYMDADFVKENPYIYLSVDGDDLIFQITALFITDIEFDYINPNPIGGELTDFFQTVERKNWLDFDGVTFSEEDTVLTLSTCCRKYDKANSGNQRLVVMAKLLPEGATAQEFSVSLVDSPEMP